MVCLECLRDPLNDYGVFRMPPVIPNMIMLCLECLLRSLKWLWCEQNAPCGPLNDYGVFRMPPVIPNMIMVCLECLLRSLKWLWCVQNAPVIS